MKPRITTDHHADEPAIIKSANRQFPNPNRKPKRINRRSGNKHRVQTPKDDGVALNPKRPRGYLHTPKGSKIPPSDDPNKRMDIHGDN